MSDTQRLIEMFKNHKIVKVTGNHVVQRNGERLNLYGGDDGPTGVLLVGTVVRTPETEEICRQYGFNVRTSNSWGY